MYATTGNHVAPEQELIAPVEIGNQAASLLHEQHPGRHIPGVEVVFVESVKPTGGYIRQIDGGILYSVYSG